MSALVTAARDRSLLAGRVGRPHGLDGSFYVTRPRPALLHEGTEVALSPSGLTSRIVRRAGTDARPIVRVGISADRDAAVALHGQELRVAAAAAPRLGADEYWSEELVGCRVHAAGDELGRVTALLELPSCECLDVERPDGGRLLVPLVRDAIRSIDVHRREIEVDAEFLGEGKETTAEPGEQP